MTLLARCVRTSLSTCRPLKRRRLSHAVGSLADPLDERTLPQAWRELVQEHGDRPALVSRHERLSTSTGDCLRWSYADMDKQVDALARGLANMGIGKGDRVATWQGNSSANAVLQWATARLGAILVSLNPALRQQELMRCLRDVGCKALFGVPALRTSDYASLLLEAFPSLSSSRPNELQDETVPSLRSVILADNISVTQPGAFDELMRRHRGLSSYEEVLDFSHTSAPTLELDCNEVQNLQFTSGTTGDPKAVSLTHRNILNNGTHIGQCMRLTNRDVLMNSPPLFHCFGLVLGNLAAWSHGACVVYPAETFDPVETVRAIAPERATVLHGVPTMFLRILETIDQLQPTDTSLDFSTLRTGIAAGSPVPGPLMSRLVSQLNLTELTNAFGQTESSPVTFQSRTTDPLQKRIDTVGKILPHVEAKVIDPADPSRVLERGQAGELLVRGYVVFKGYWGDDEATRKTMYVDEEGKEWLRTGDLASLDEEGYLTIKGRIKDLIIRGGENIVPVVVENHLLAHADIADAAAVAVPDDLLGETVGLFIKRRTNASLTPQDVRSQIRSRYPQASPAYIWFLGDADVPSSWPQTPSGKIRKVELRALAKELAKRGIGKVEKVPGLTR